MNDIWQDPSAAWWSKAARALKHIQDACSLAATFEMGRPYEVCREAAGRPGEVAFRFRLLKRAPVELLTTIGDALHNMRSCLDSVAFELARQSAGQAMTDEQMRAASFPICLDRARFDNFFDRNDVRRALYGQRERDALRCVQPFAIREEAAALGVDLSTSPQDEYRFDELARLSVLSNIDKHRRLPLLAWYLELVYWAGDDPRCEWTQVHPLGAAIDHDSVIGCMSHESGDDSLIPLPVIQLELALADDPATPHDPAGTLERWHSYLVSWVLPRIFAVADGYRAPIVIMR